MMMESPGLEISVRPATTWKIEGALAERAFVFAQCLLQKSPEIDPSRTFHIQIHRSPGEHVGLGSGTQLALAVGQAIAELCQLPLDPLELAARVGRGRRSCLGIHGFYQGGFLVEGGRGPQSAFSPLLCRHKIPADWRILLAIPHGIQGAHGRKEVEAFDFLSHIESPRHHTAELCRLVLLGMLPSLLESDLPAFSEAVFDFNRRVGEFFLPWQGGIYSHAITSEIIAFLRKQGIAGVGQTSWGPTVFALVAEDMMESVSRNLQKAFPSSLEVIASKPMNCECHVEYD